MGISPIVLFTYNRPNHTRKTIRALQRNYLAQDSNLFVFSDGPKDWRVVKQVEETRAYLRTINGFKSIAIIEHEDNRGLASNIIGGVTEIVQQYGKVIVLEDDIVTNKYFLQFMNQALEYYAAENRVMHVSGWNYPIDPAGLPPTFLWRVMNCWGWGTWAECWRNYSRDPEGLVAHFTRQDIKCFNLDNTHNFWSQVVLNIEGKIDTWAIFWYATIFMKKGLCLNPTETLVHNIGHDGSGVHCGKQRISLPELRHHRPIIAPGESTENKLAVERVKAYLRRQRPSFVRRVAGRLKRVLTE